MNLGGRKDPRTILPARERAQDLGGLHAKIDDLGLAGFGLGKTKAGVLPIGLPVPETEWTLRRRTR